jgi:hypothetical protein
MSAFVADLTSPKLTCQYTDDVIDCNCYPRVS